MSKPKIILIDGCCKAGGAARGYYEAAQELGYDIEITGVDINPQPRYPYNFQKSDCIHYLIEKWKKFNFFHFSPPCQKYSVATNRQRAAGKEYKDILTPLQILIKKYGLPAIIENVPSAPLRKDIVLRGDMFGLRTLRKRVFELHNLFMLQPGFPLKKGSVHTGEFVTVCGNGDMDAPNGSPLKVPGNSVVEVWSNAMGIDWMNRAELAEAIPPAYTKYIGLQLFPQIINRFYL